MYAFSENFVLPLSHDEVVHMKGSLLNKMPGDNDLKYAGVRAFYTYMLTHPGKKLMMMGSEFAQWNEWHFEHSLDWHLLDQQDEDGERHRQTKAFFQTANDLYLQRSELWEVDFDWAGFQWLCADDASANTVAFLRRNKKGDFLLVVCNFSPVDRNGYRVGVPVPGRYGLLLNSDDEAFGGQGVGDRAPIHSEPIPCHGQDQSMAIHLPPMSALIYRCVRRDPVRRRAAAPRKTAKGREAPVSKKTRAPKKASQ